MKTMIFRDTPTGVIAVETGPDHLSEDEILETVITDDELNMLFAEVVKKHPAFRNCVWRTNFWDVTKGYLKRLFCQGKSSMFVYSIANELSIKNTNSHNLLGDGAIDDGDRVAFKLYVVIYYKYKDNPKFSIMLGALAPQMGKLGERGRLNEIQGNIDALRVKYGMSKGDVATNGGEKAMADGLAREVELLKKRNEELEHENKCLKAELSERQTPNDSYEEWMKAKETIEELREENARLNDYKEKVKGLTARQTAILGYKLAERLGALPSNKKQLAIPLSKISGYGKRSLEQKVCTYFEEEEELELAGIFGDDFPTIARMITPKWQGTPLP
ncbi:MAG: hypothetical protein IJP75_06555 [Bacteroidaceae bacterium]|nr:hypothetical protein [Bacteroidaceae bacterium]